MSTAIPGALAGSYSQKKSERASTSRNVPGTVVLRDANGAFDGVASSVADNAITSAKIANDTIVDADVKSDAAIAGTKILPNFGSQNISTTGTLSAGGGSVISAASGADALRITQTGAGHALLVEDSANPDSTPFVIRANGDMVQGHTTVENWWYSSSNVPRSYFVNTTNGAGVNAIGVGTHGVLQMIRTNSATIGGRGIVSSGDFLGWIRFAGDDAVSASAAVAADIIGAVDGTPGTNDMPGRLVFRTTADGASAPTERIRIDSAGNVGIGGTANAAAILDTASTTKGFLPPRMTTAQRDAISTPPAGLVIYNTSTNVLNFYNGSAWGAV